MNLSSNDALTSDLLDDLSLPHSLVPFLWTRGYYTFQERKIFFKYQILNLVTTTCQLVIWCNNGGGVKYGPRLDKSRDSRLYLISG